MNLKFSCLDNEHKKRLSSYLSDLLPVTSKRQLKLAIQEGMVLINNKAVYKDVIPSRHDHFEVPRSILAFSIGSVRISLKGYKLDVIEEHRDFILIRKQREMHSVLIRHNDPVTLADLIAESYPENIGAGRSPCEAGLVQRLDYYTSGLLVSARCRDAWEDLHRKFISGQITKEYHAFVEGQLEIDRAVGGHQIKTIETQATGTLVSFITKQGERHIVRKVLSSLNHPLKGDSQYGSKTDSVELDIFGRKQKLKGFYLDAVKIIGL